MLRALSRGDTSALGVLASVNVSLHRALGQSCHVDLAAHLPFAAPSAPLLFAVLSPALDSRALLLLRAFAQAGADLEARDEDQRTVLAMACLCGRERVVQELLARGTRT